MKVRLSIILAAVAVAVSCMSTVRAEPVQRLAWRIYANRSPWDQGYYNPAWGQPHALVVPPTAELQSHYRWGVTGTDVTPIYHQFGRARPPVYLGPGSVPTPPQPWSTDQFGVYYIRGPWR
ncbi:MAG TPA: hypothetical protein VHV77_18245 [Pirellulales bacterium]|jgi:hypothetical protein|nr:hypothetical protein [Pirellulales bacterium]